MNTFLIVLGIIVLLNIISKAVSQKPNEFHNNERREIKPQIKDTVKYEKQKTSSPINKTSIRTNRISDTRIIKEHKFSPRNVFHENYVSFSRLKSFDNCPRLFELVYLCGNKDESGYAAEKGSLVHKILEILFRDKEGEVREIIESISPNFASHMRSLFYESQKEEDFKYSFEFSEILPYLEVFLNQNRNRDEVFVMQERTINTTIGPYDLKCIIDRIDIGEEDMRLIDYKTGRSDYVLNKQLEVYGYAAGEGIFVPATLEYQFLGEGHIKEWRFTEAKYNAVEKWVLSKIEKIENTRYFPTKRSGLCKYCTFHGLCY